MSISKLNPYSDYIDSGVEWLGQIPSHWKPTRNKDIFVERGSLSQSGSETLLTVSHITGVTRRSEKTVNMFMAETMEGYKHCKTGDLIINTMWAWMGALGTAREDGICSPAYGVYAPRKGLPYSHGYFDYLYRTLKAVSEMTRNSKGIVSSRLRLYPKDFFQILTALPSYEEQAAIAAYLDIKTKQIDRQIDLLDQKATKYGKLKQSLINETVTRGLDKSVGMKDSGVEWIGKTPTHWNVRRLKEVVDVHMGQSPSSSDYTEEGLGFPFLQGNADFGNYSPTPRVWCSEVKKVCLKNDVLLSVRAPVGAVNVASASYGIGRGLCAIRSKSNYQYWYYFLLSMSSYLNSIATGSTYVAVSIEDVRNSMACVPPAHEQAKITSYLNERTERIDRIVTAINYQLEKLKDLRKALINDVVTGKIKVVGIGNDE